MYKPYFNNETPANEDKLMIHYDVNSLYPNYLDKFKFPYQISDRFTGNIKLIDDFKELYNNTLDIYKVKVIALDIIHQFILIRIKQTSV